MTHSPHYTTTGPDPEEELSALIRRLPEEDADIIRRGLTRMAARFLVAAIDRDTLQAAIATMTEATECPESDETRAT